MNALKLFLFYFAFTTTGNALPLHNGKVEFLARGKPGFLKIAGKGAEPQGDIQILNQKLSGKITCDLRKFVTGIELRDDHMKNKYLEVGLYPESTFTFENITLPSPLESLNGATIEAPGQFSLHGVTKPTVAKVSFSKEGSLLKSKAEFEINIQDYNITVPEFSGVTVAREVQVHVEAQVTLP